MSCPVEILIVDDDPNDVDLTLHALEQNHLANDVQVVRDGAEAIDFLFGLGRYSDRAAADLPRVVLLDLKLPKVDGIEVLRRIKSEERTRTLPVVVMTSSREERDVVDAYRLGVNSYVTKPMDFREFTDAVRQLGLYWLLVNHAPGDRD